MALLDNMDCRALREELFDMEERLKEMLKSSFRRNDLESERARLDDLFRRIPETPRWKDAKDFQAPWWREIGGLNRSFLSLSAAFDLLERAYSLSRRYFTEDGETKEDSLAKTLRGFEDDIVLRFERKDILLDYLRASHFVIRQLVPLFSLVADGYFDLDLFRCASIQIGIEDDAETLLVHFCRFAELVDGLEMLVPEVSTGVVRRNYRLLYSPWLKYFLGYAPRTSLSLIMEQSGEHEKREARKLVLSYLDGTFFEPQRWSTQRPVMDAVVRLLGAWARKDNFFLSSLIAIVCRRGRESAFIPLMRRIEEDGSIRELLP